MPLEQLSNNLDFFSFYVASKQAVTGLTVTVDVWKHLTSTNTSSQIVTAGSATEVGGGLYRYQLSSASVTGEGEYICIFKTTSTVPDQQHIPSIWCVQKAGSEYLDAAVTTRASATDYTSTRAGYLDRLDATISSRQASGNVTVAGYASGQDPATLVWAASTRTLSGFGFSVTVGTNNDKTGYALAVTPPTAQQIWDTLTSALTTVGSVGKRIADNLDDTVSSRFPSTSYTAPDNTSVGTILSRTDVATSSRASGADYTTARANKLDNLDASITSRAAQSDYSSARAAKLDNLDTTVSSRLPTSSYTAPSSITSLQADVTSIKSTVTTNLDATISSRQASGNVTIAGYAAGQDPVTLTGVTTTRAAKLDYLDATVSSRLPTSSYVPVSGSGSTSYTVTVTKADGTSPLEGCAVWVSSDVAGNSIQAGTLYTNSAGQAVFSLDLGTHYLWRQLQGWEFTNPTLFTVS